MTGEGGEPPPSFIGGAAQRERQATQVPRTGQARGSHSARSAQLGAPHTSHMWREREGGLVCVVSLSAPPHLPEKSRPVAPQSVGRRHFARRRISSNDLSRTGSDEASST